MQATPGFSSARGRALWHRFNLVREKPFIRWLMALGVPLTQASLKAMGNVTWQTLSGHNVKNWQSLPGTGERKARQIVVFIPDPGVAGLASWLGKQGLPGF